MRINAFILALISILCVLGGCDNQHRLPNIAELKPSESFAILNYLTHYQEVGARSNVGFAYKFTRNDTDFTFTVLDPYTDDVFSTNKFTSSVSVEQVLKLQDLIDYYRLPRLEENDDNGVNYEIHWKSRNWLITEKYANRFFEIGDTTNYYFALEEILIKTGYRTKN